MEVLFPDELNGLSDKPVKINYMFRLLIGLVCGGLFLFGAAGLSAAVYLLPVDDGFVRSVTSVVPYPVALVNLRPISFKDFYEEYDAMQSFYEANETPETDRLSASEISSSILDNKISHVAIAQLAGQYSVKLDEAKVEERLQTAYVQGGSEETFYSEIERIFGWNREDFLTHAMEPLVLASQVEEEIWNDAELQAEALAKMNGVLARMEDGEDFSVVAGEVSEDPSAENGGDIGHLTVETMPSEWVDFVASAELNVPSGIIDLGQAFSLVTVTEKIDGEEATQYNLKVIIVYKRGLSEVKDGFLASSKVWRFLKI